MATITIKIDSDDLAREVLAQLGYLPEDDIPDLVSVEEEEPPRAPKTHVEDIHERMKDPLGFPEATRKMPEEPKQNAFCTTEDPKPDVEPVDNEMGAPLEVYSDEAKNEREDLYKQSMDVRVPPPEERLKTQLDELWGCDRLDHLDAMADHNDKAMRLAVKSYVLKEYAGHNLKSWPALKKIIDSTTDSCQ
jgi:uncharacterized protein (DUF2249 family)